MQSCLAMGKNERWSRGPHRQRFLSVTAGRASFAILLRPANGPAHGGRRETEISQLVRGSLWAILPEDIQE